jgi:predicted O-methyltransferase YrrM
MNSPETIRKTILIPPEGESTSIREAEAQFIYDLLLKEKAVNTLETGFAWGRSTAYIMAASIGKHTVADPFQHNFKDAGLGNIRLLGLEDRLDFHREASHIVLPGLMGKGMEYDFAFIDGDHRFDGIFVDFFYAAMLLKPGGLVMFHDTWMRSTVLVDAFIRKNRKDFTLVPTPHRSMVLFRKTGIDERKWHHFREFYSLRSWLRWQVLRIMGRV